MFATLLFWNIVFAAVVAVLVGLAGRTHYLCERPALRHCLWLLVLGKLVTPPLVPLPVLAPNSKSAVADLVKTDTSERSVRTAAIHESGSRPVAFNSGALGASGAKVTQEDVATQSGNWSDVRDSNIQFAGLMRRIDWFVVLCSISLAVTIALIVCVFVQLRRLSRLLHRGHWESAKVNAIARREAQVMGIRQTPSVCVVNSVITPILWVKQARPVVVLPKSLLQQLTDEQIACVVSHELAHFARRDHWSNAVACFVGCLFWWHPVVWWAQRELKIAQEACCDAMVIHGTPAIRRSYAETLLQVIELVGGERSTPQLASGFGEAFSIRRRFEMIANERVTPRLSRMTRLFMAVLIGTACCYPVMAQPENNTDTNQVGGSGEVEAALLQYYMQFDWKTKHVATLTFKYPENANGKGVVTLRTERYPESSLISMMKALHDVRSIKFARLTTESPQHDSEFVTVILESEPLASAALPSAIADLSKYFTINRVSISPSTKVETTQQEALSSETSRSDAELHRQQQELLNALLSALPADANEFGWRIELQGIRNYPSDDQVKAIPLKHVDVVEVVKVVSAMELPDVKIDAVPQTNEILVSGTPSQLEQILALIAELDRNTSSKSVLMLPIGNVEADKAALLIRKTFASEANTPLTVTTADDRLIVRGATERVQQQIRNLLTGLEWLAESAE